MLNDNTGIIAWFTRNPVAANLLMVIILIVGLSSALKLRVEGFPAFAPNTVSIDVNYPSGDAKQAEEGITIKIEQALQGVLGVKEIRSNSSGEGVNITVERISGYSLDTLNRDIKNKIDGIFGLPALAEKPIISQQQLQDHALWISIYGDTNQHDLQQLARTFEQELLRKNSINKVELHGWKKPEISIEVDENALQAYNLTIQDISQRISQESINQTSGELRSKNKTVLLKASRQAYDDRDFSEIILRSYKDGTQLKLGDIASVTDIFEETPNTLSRFQGQRAIGLKLIVDSKGDVLAIAKQAKTLVQEWTLQQRIPAETQIDIWWDQSQFMSDRLSLLAKNGIIGIALVVLVLSIFLNLKVAFWVAMGLPICFSGALLLMGESFFNLSLNDLTSFGFIIVLGILVDDAVVVGESIYSTRRKHGDNINSTIYGVKRIAVPTMFGVLTTIAAFYPMSYISGEMGTVFSQFALVAVACLLFSMIESKLILPAHLSQVKTSNGAPSNIFAKQLHKIQSTADNLLLWVDKRVYQPGIKLALHHRYNTVIVFTAVLIFVVGMIPSGTVSFVFFPNIPRSIIEINYTAESGNGYGATHEQAYRIESIVDDLNEKWKHKFNINFAAIENVQTLLSSDLNGTTTLELKKASSKHISSEQLVDELRQVLGKPIGFKEFKIISEFGDIDDFNLKVIATNPEQLSIAHTDILQKLRSYDGVSDIQSDMSSGQTRLKLDVNAEGRSLGLTTESLARQIQEAYYGAEVQRIQRGKDEVKVRVLYPLSQRQDSSDLHTARIRTPSGAIVPLTTIADISSEPNQTEIRHVNGRLSLSFTAKIDKTRTSPEKVMSALKNDSLNAMKQESTDYSFIEGGETAEQTETVDSMLNVFVFSLLIIYTLLAIPLKSYWQPIIIMSAIPFGIVGAILGHWFLGISISILSLNGILALSGVVVNDSLLLVSRYNELKNDEAPLKAIAMAGSQRLRAILLTSITTYVGLASLLQETSEQAQYLIPAAASLAYGILFATLITLVLIPALLAISLDIDRMFSKLLRTQNIKKASCE